VYLTRPPDFVGIHLLSCFGGPGATYKHLNAVSPGISMSAHWLRLIQCFSTPGWQQHCSWHGRWRKRAQEEACTGAGRKVAQQ